MTDWISTDVTTAAAGAPLSAAGGPLAATLIRGGTLLPEVYFIDADNHVRELAWNGSNWQTTDVTAAAGCTDRLPAAGSPLATTGISGGTLLPEVYFTDANNHVRELAWDGSNWQTSDVTANAHAPLPAARSPLAAINIASGYFPEVYFTDAGNHVCQLAWDGSNWQTSDVTAAAAAPPALAAGSPLAAWSIGSNVLPEVYFTDAGNHVCQLAWDGSNWQTSDVTAAAAAPSAAAGSPLAAWSIAADWFPEVYFTDADNRVWELGWAGSSTQSWMGNVDGSKYLSQLSIPATHDTLTFNATAVAQDQDASFDIAAQLNAGIRMFDLRLAEDDTTLNPDGSGAILIGAHGSFTFGPVTEPFVIANTEFWANILNPTIQFLQANPTECVIYMIMNCGQTLNCGGIDPTWDNLVRRYINDHGPQDPSWSGYYMDNQVPTLDDVRGKIILCNTATPTPVSEGGWGGLDLSGGTPDTFGTHTNSLTLPDGGPVTFHVQGYYDDSPQAASSRAGEATAIQQNIAGAAANGDPHHWFMTGTNRSGGLPSSREFALGGGLDDPWPMFYGYNKIALDAVNLVPITQGNDQQTVGVVTSDFPNDTGGYIEVIIARNPGLP